MSFPPSSFRCRSALVRFVPGLRVCFRYLSAFYLLLIFYGGVEGRLFQSSAMTLEQTIALDRDSLYTGLPLPPDLRSEHFDAFSVSGLAPVVGFIRSRHCRRSTLVAAFQALCI